MILLTKVNANVFAIAFRSSLMVPGLSPTLTRLKEAHRGQYVKILEWDISERRSGVIFPPTSLLSCCLARLGKESSRAFEKTMGSNSS